MMLHSTNRRRAAGLAVGAIFALFLSGVAYAITSNVFKYSKPKTGWLTIDPMAMMPTVDGVDFEVTSSGLLTTGDPSACFRTGLHLPDRAKITNLTAWYGATTAGDVHFFLGRNSLGSGSSLTLLSESTDTTGNRARASYTLPEPGTKVSPAYTFVFMVCLSSTGEFRGARLAYKYTTAGD